MRRTAQYCITALLFSRTTNFPNYIISATRVQSGTWGRSFCFCPLAHTRNRGREQKDLNPRETGGQKQKDRPLIFSRSISCISSRNRRGRDHWDILSAFSSLAYSGIRLCAVPQVQSVYSRNLGPSWYGWTG